MYFTSSKTQHNEGFTSNELSRKVAYVTDTQESLLSIIFMRVLKNNFLPKIFVFFLIIVFFLFSVTKRFLFARERKSECSLSTLKFLSRLVFQKSSNQTRLTILTSVKVVSRYLYEIYVRYTEIKKRQIKIETYENQLQTKFQLFFANIYNSKVCDGIAFLSIRILHGYLMTFKGAKLAAWLLHVRKVGEVCRRCFEKFNKETSCKLTIHQLMGHFLEFCDVRATERRFTSIFAARDLKHHLLASLMDFALRSH